VDAIRALEEGVGSIEDIDNSMKLGCGHPMGPLTLLDFGIGYDVLHFAIMYERVQGTRFAAPPFVKRDWCWRDGMGEKWGVGFVTTAIRQGL